MPCKQRRKVALAAPGDILRRKDIDPADRRGERRAPDFGGGNGVNRCLGRGDRLNVSLTKRRTGLNRRSGNGADGGQQYNGHPERTKETHKMWA